MNRIIQRAIILISCTLLTSSCTTNSQNQESKPKTPEEARQELAKLNLDYNQDSFYVSARQGDTLAVELFLTAGMEPSMGLVGAAERGHTELAKSLLEKGANPNSSYTAIDEIVNCSFVIGRAAKNGDVELVTALINKGVDVNIEEGCALKDAIRQGQTSVAELLLKNGANADSTTVDFAIENKQAGIVKLLMAQGIKVNLEDIAIKAANSGDAETIKFVIDSGLDPNARIGENYFNLATNQRFTILMETIRNGGNIDVVRTLLEKGANPNLCVSLATTGFGGGRGDVCPLSMALSKNRNDLEEVLRSAGATCETRNAVFAD